MPFSHSRDLTSASDTDIGETFDGVLLVIFFLIMVKALYHNIRDYNDLTPNIFGGSNAVNRFSRTEGWDSYIESKLTVNIKPENQTKLFFDAIEPCLRLNFNSSINQIIQFGIATGEYVIEQTKLNNRRIIGYEKSKLAATHLQQNNVETRCIDLDAKSSTKLNYQSRLKEDFSRVSDVLLIRILEYLEPDTVRLLMLSFIKFAQPGTKFYIETCTSPKNRTKPTKKIDYSKYNGINFFGKNAIVSYYLKPGTISGFFAGRKDFKVDVLSDVKNPRDLPGYTVERLYIEKLSPKN